MNRDARNFRVLGLLKAGVTREQAEAELTSIASRPWRTSFPTRTRTSGSRYLMTFSERQNGGPIRLVFLTLMGAVGLRAAHRDRQRRQSAARARRASIARDQRSRVARRDALADRPAAAGRKRPARGDQRRPRLRSVVGRRAAVRCRHAGRRQAVVDPFHDGRARLCLPRRHHAGHRTCCSAWRRRCTCRRRTSTRS